jgi:divalent metal cation (Fe/Co/Zn/Cd) transporter
MTVLWNAVEALVALAAGAVSGSVSLLGFGIDSVIESSSGIILLWQLSDVTKREFRERTALKLVGLSFLFLALYVAIEAMRSLITRTPPEKSWVGVTLALVSLMVMPLLARAKRRLGAQLRSPALLADSRQTEFCAYLSAILLAGLSFNAAFGWWWADPAAALAMVPIIGREGYEALKGGSCRCTVA